MTNNIHERFYGQALREIQQGIRRDDLWAKAFSLSSGNSKKTKALYLELLAEYFSEFANLNQKNNFRTQGFENITPTGTINPSWKVFLVGFSKFTICIVIFILSVAALGFSYNSMRKNYLLEIANNYQPQEISDRQFYRAVVADENGVDLNNFPAEINDALTLSGFQIIMKYGFDRGQYLMNESLRLKSIYRHKRDASVEFIEVIKANIFIFIAFTALSFMVIFSIIRYVLKYKYLKN